MKSFVYSVLFFLGIVSLLSCKEETTISPTQPTPTPSTYYATLRVQVLNGTDQKPAQNALVTLSPNNRVKITDAAGACRFDSVTLGGYTLQAAKAGFVSQTASLTITTDALPVITLVLSASATIPIINSPPTAPTLVSPAINSVVQSTTATLRWKATDPNSDTLRYDVALYKAGSTTPAFSYTNLPADSVVVPNLDYGTSYLWQVTVKDGINRPVSGPIWSFSIFPYPNYSYLFTRRINGQYQIFASNASGNPVQLTRNGSNWRPVASPNGQQIAYISNANTTLQLFIMNLDGSNMRQVTTIPISGLNQTDLSFCWSPDGSQLVYPNNNRLYAIRTDGTGLYTVTQVGNGRLFAGCDWTAQGNRLVARTTGSTVYDNEISTFKPDGSETRTVFVRNNSRVGNPIFSITGGQLIFTADSLNFSNDQGRQLDSRILLLDLNTTGTTDLSKLSGANRVIANDKPTGTNDLDPRLSPNGAQIIFTNADNSDQGTRSVYSITISVPGQDNRNRKLLFTSAEMPYWRQP